MSDFTEFEQFEHVAGTRNQYRLTSDLIWEVGKKGSEWVLVIPAGTWFDISVPRWLEWLQSPHDERILPGAAIHDELGNQGFDIGFASSEFRRACSAKRAGPVRAWSMFYWTLIYTALWRLRHWGGLNPPPDYQQKRNKTHRQ